MCAPLACSLLADPRTDPRVTIAAIKLLESIIGTYPTKYGSLLRQLGPLLHSAAFTIDDGARPQHAQQFVEFVSATAAAAFAQLMLSNKLKVHELMGTLGCGLSSKYTCIISSSRYILQRLLEAATGAGERAALVWGVAQQHTPISLRIAATEAALELVSDDDKQNDAFVAPYIAAVLAVCRRPANTGDSVALQVTSIMLRVLRPSVKMLRNLKSGLESCNRSTSTAVPGNFLRDVQDFVKRAVDKTAGNDGLADGGQDAIASGKKRGRPGGVIKSSIGQLQQDVLRMLGEITPLQKRVLHSNRNK